MKRIHYERMRSYGEKVKSNRKQYDRMEKVKVEPVWLKDNYGVKKEAVNDRTK